MNRVRQWIGALGLSLGLLCAGCERPDAPAPGAAAALQQKRARQQRVIEERAPPEVSAEVARLLDEVEDALDDARGAWCGNSYDPVFEASKKVAALGPDVIPALLYRLEHTAGYRGRAAIYVFSDLAQDAQPALLPLVRLIERAPLWVRHRALDSLRQIEFLDAAALEALLRVRDDEDQHPVVRSWADAVIAQLAAPPELRGGIPDPTLTLRGLLEDEQDPQLRWEAVVALGETSRAWGEAVDALVHALKEDESGRVRAQAATELSEPGYEHETRVVALTRALEDPEPRVRAAAARALATFGPEARYAMPALTLALHDREADVQIHAIHALTHIGPGAAAAIPALQRPDAAWIRSYAEGDAREIAGDAAAE